MAGVGNHSSLIWPENSAKQSPPWVTLSLLTMGSHWGKDEKTTRLRRNPPHPNSSSATLTHEAVFIDVGSLISSAPVIRAVLFFERIPPPPALLPAVPCQIPVLTFFFPSGLVLVTVFSLSSFLGNDCWGWGDGGGMGKEMLFKSSSLFFFFSCDARVSTLHSAGA